MKTIDFKENTEGWPKSDGRTVPEGYFDDFARRIMAQIPEEVCAKKEPERTVWQKIRPYVYMAAMFAGVYLMMNIFTLTTGIRDAVNANDASMQLADLVTPSTSSFLDEYIATNDTYFYDDMYESGYEIPENI